MNDTMEEIPNKIAQSGLISIDLKDFYLKGVRKVIDIKDWLFEGVILKEKMFRQRVMDEDWSVYKDSFVAITSTADAIIPTWAYLILTTELQPYAKKIVIGDLQCLEILLFRDTISEKLNPFEYKDKRVMLKGCSDADIPLFAYGFVVSLLKPYVKSIMYGEACSNVPVYKLKT